MDEILNHWRDWQTLAGASDRTIDERAGVIRHLVSHSGASTLDVDQRHIVAYLARKGLKSSSRATYHATIRAHFTFLMAPSLRTDDPSAGIPTPRRERGVPRPVPTDGLVRMLTIVNRKRGRMMILLGALAGLRVHEIAKVHDDDVDHERQALRVTGKGGHTALIPLHDLILDLVPTVGGAGYWFPSPTPGREHVTRSAVYSSIAGVMRRAGLDTTPHQLRHWFGTSLVEADVNLRVVQELMRHASPSTTAIYSAVRLDQRAAGISLLKLAA